MYIISIFTCKQILALQHKYSGDRTANYVHTHVET